MRLNGGLRCLSPEAPPAEKTILLHKEIILGSICKSTDATRQNHNAPILINDAARSRCESSQVIMGASGSVASLDGCHWSVSSQSV